MSLQSCCYDQVMSCCESVVLMSCCVLFFFVGHNFYCGSLYHTILRICSKQLKFLVNFLQKLYVLAQVPTGGVPIVHRNPTWSDRSVWFQAGWGGNHPVHSGDLAFTLLKKKNDRQTDIFTWFQVSRGYYPPHQRQIGKWPLCPISPP